MKKPQNCRAFGVIELLVIIGILAIFAAVFH